MDNGQTALCISIKTDKESLTIPLGRIFGDLFFHLCDRLSAQFLFRIRNAAVWRRDFEKSSGMESSSPFATPVTALVIAEENVRYFQKGSYLFTSSE